MGLDGISSFEVGDGSRNLENSGVGAVAQPQAIYCKFQQAFAGTVDTAEFAHFTRTRLRVAKFDCAVWRVVAFFATRRCVRVKCANSAVSTVPANACWNL